VWGTPDHCRVQTREFGNLFEHLGQVHNLSAQLLMSPEKYTAIDCQLATSKLMTDRDADDSDQHGRQ